MALYGTVLSMQPAVGRLPWLDCAVIVVVQAQMHVCAVPGTVLDQHNSDDIIRNSLSTESLYF